MPDLDIVEGSDDDVDTLAQVIGNLDGEGCVLCHDADPFIYTPFLTSAGWEPAGGELGPYGLVQPDGSLASTGVHHLVEPEVAACTSCHRLGDGASCTTFAIDALGGYAQAPYDAESSVGAFSRWMPHNGSMLSSDDYDATYGAARDKIMACCGAGVAERYCAWEPIPAE